MRHLLFPLLIVALIGCRRDASPEMPPGKPKVEGPTRTKEPATDEERIQGVWQTQPERTTGRSTRIDALWQFKDKQVITQETYSGKRSTVEGTFAMDAKSSPKTLDLIMADEQKYACIYEFQDDRLRVCFEEGGPRPSQFSADGNRILLVFKRQ